MNPYSLIHTYLGGQWPYPKYNVKGIFLNTDDLNFVPSYFLDWSAK